MQARHRLKTMIGLLVAMLISPLGVAKLPFSEPPTHQKMEKMHKLHLNDKRNLIKKEHKYTDKAGCMSCHRVQ